MDDDEDAVVGLLTVHVLTAKIKPMLAGRSPEVQSAVLADLAALWLVGYPDFMREDFLEGFVDYVRQLVPINESLIFGPAGHPDNGKERDH